MTPSCKKPCYDCPFRKDIPPYQDLQALFQNIARSLARKPQACHHSELDASSFSRPKPHPRPVTCAGNVIFIRQLIRQEGYGQAESDDDVERVDQEAAAVHPEVPDRPATTAIIFSSLDELVRHATRAQTHLARVWNWWAVQPAHTRIPLAQAIHAPDHHAASRQPAASCPQLKNPAS